MTTPKRKPSTRVGESSAARHKRLNHEARLAREARLHKRARHLREIARGTRARLLPRIVAGSEVQWWDTDSAGNPTRTTGIVVGFTELPGGSTAPGTGSRSRALLGTAPPQPGRVSVVDARPIVASVRPYSAALPARMVPPQVLSVPADAVHVCLLCRARRTWPDICPCCTDAPGYRTEWSRCPRCHSWSTLVTVRDWPDYYRSCDDRERWSDDERAALPDLREPRTGGELVSTGVAT